MIGDWCLIVETELPTATLRERRPLWLPSAFLLQSSITNPQSSILRAPAPTRHRLEADAPADRRRDDSELGHQPVELRGEHRLRAVAQGVIRIAIDLDDQSV